MIAFIIFFLHPISRGCTDNIPNNKNQLLRSLDRNKPSDKRERAESYNEGGHEKEDTEQESEHTKLEYIILGP